MLDSCYRVHLGNLSDFVNTSCVTNLTFITEAEDSPDGASQTFSFPRLDLSANSSVQRNL